MKKHPRVSNVIAKLSVLYPRKDIIYLRKPFHILITTILSAQCTDKTAERVAADLFNKYNSPKQFAELKLLDLHKIIRPAGLYRNKSKAIIELSKKLLNKYGAKVPDSIDELIKLPGVGRKTANVVMAHAFNRAEGVAVDTHVARVSNRLGLSDNKNPQKIEKDLLGIIPKKDWLKVNHLLISHGRAVCKARKPLCCECGIREFCPSANCV
ncbi:MAG: endonuclease III [Candidatus Omnitrophota bacterium]